LRFRSKDDDGTTIQHSGSIEEESEVITWAWLVLRIAFGPRDANGWDRDRFFTPDKAADILLSSAGHLEEVE